ncbi:MAG: flavin reductase [delta proteobacterium ML8_D]|nr:MAG: flavin reductase [delta proteobacterium ML8_D]
MFVLGLQGSPRSKGNTGILLSAFLNAAAGMGAQTRYLDVAHMAISPCTECGICEKQGFCPIDDDMQQIYPLLRRADLIVMATPIFFYGTTAQIKALIDRSQALWARKYIHKLNDPLGNWRNGLLLSLGATKGKDLFEGVSLTAKYFFDAVGAHFKGGLTYRQIEEPGDIRKHTTALADTIEKAKALVTPSVNRKKILFICTDNTCFSQMASAFTQCCFGDRIEAESAGIQPAREINALMIEAMEEKGIDLAFRRPKSIEQAILHGNPDFVISVGCGETCSILPGIPYQYWPVADTAGKSLETMRRTRDEIEERIKRFNF